jgi:hypothetical protein
MTLVVEKNVTTNPTDIGLLGFVGVMLEPNSVSNLIEELLRSRFHG